MVRSNMGSQSISCVVLGNCLLLAKVLQEVATARHVHMLCGPSEIDGYAFCMGVEALSSLFDSHLALQGRIYSVTTLMKESIFRENQTSPLGLTGLDKRPLAELLAMYHTHKATRLHDKLYALLGMCSDDLEAAKLLPDYSIPWQELFKRICRFFFSQKIIVETWSDKEVAVIKSKGIVIGCVDNQMKAVPGLDGTFRLSFDTIQWWPAVRFKRIRLPPRAIPMSARPVRDGDLICQLESSPNFTVIRLCEDHFEVIFAALKPPAYLFNKDDIRFEDPELRWPAYVSMVESTIYDFDIVWDWNWDQGEYPGSGERCIHLVRPAEDQISQCDFSRLIRMLNVEPALQNARKVVAAQLKVLRD
jgi:hypothetical protein